MIDGQFTLGVEEEYQIIDPEPRDLKPGGTKIIEDSRSILKDRVRPEMHQSMVEVGTGICNDVDQVHAELVEMRRELARVAAAGGMSICAASTHPFADWRTQAITDHTRYHNIVHDLQDVARANLIFGLHIHVGFKEKDVAVAIANQVRYFLPHLLALSASSPFWEGRNTGLKSFRSQVFKRFPRTGIPDEFENYAQLERFVQTLIRTGCIDNGKKLWWDVRPHWHFDTVEIRICDMPANMEHTVAIVALVQALMAKLYLMYRRNTAWKTYGRMLLEENKWRAVRYGAEANLIDFGMNIERPFTELARELVEFVSETTAIFGTQKHMKTILDIAYQGTSADRQVEVFEKTGDTRAVVDWLMAETMKGI